MDAQNATEAASTKPAAPLKQRGTSEADNPPTRTSDVSRLHPPNKLSSVTRESKSASVGHTHDDDGAGDGNSDAETIVLPGKDGHSPSKVRKIIKHEEKVDDESSNNNPSSRKVLNGSRGRGRDSEPGDRINRPDKPSTSAFATGNDSIPFASSVQMQKKKHNEKPRSKDASSGLSSAPASPPPHRRRRLSHAHTDSDSDAARVKLAKSHSNQLKEKHRLLESEKPSLPKRKAPKVESEDDENRKARRQRTSGPTLERSQLNSQPNRNGSTSATRDPKPLQVKSQNDARSASRVRSISPQPRSHRRSISTQLPSQSSTGSGHKKKRIPAPLQFDYFIDDPNEVFDPDWPPEPLLRRSLTTPTTAESPAKMAPHKKHLDAHGQTFLARACARGEFDVAKQRLQERPDDIDFADYAGNTPLQIAALNGYDDIVKLLVEAGCSLDCVNYDKDTPLLDAVDNGHLEVVKVLLDAGMNPRKANTYGQEPLDRVTDDIDNADEIRAALRAARDRVNIRRRTSEEHQLPDQADGQSSHGPDSPRRSPAPSSLNSASAAGRRAGTVRSTKTSNHLLYMPMDDKTLRAAAGRGDEETVTRILQVRDKFDDPESMVAAARGGHETIMQLLLALGDANPDPGPIPPNNEFSTPMLAAIGQDNHDNNHIKVVRLLLDQGNFDPTRRFKGETYYQIARRRRGPHWEEEEHILKKAYDRHKEKKASTKAKNKSPSNKEMLEKDARRSRVELKEHQGNGEKEKEKERDKDRDRDTGKTKEEAPNKAHKPKAPSPARESKKLISSKANSPKEGRRSESHTVDHDGQTSPKRGPGRPKKDDRLPTIAAPGRDASPSSVKLPPTKTKRTESDIAAVSSEGETIKAPRRKLISGRELKGEREKQRRGSITSNASSLREPSSPREPRNNDDRAERPAHKLDKHLGRTETLRRDESRDRLSVSGDGSGKRHRASATPPLHGTDKDTGEAPLKRRRLDVEQSRDKRQKLSSSPDDRPRRSAPSAEPLGAKLLGSKLPKERDKVGDVDVEDRNRKMNLGIDHGSVSKTSDTKTVRDRERERGRDRNSEDSRSLPASKKHDNKSDLLLEQSRKDVNKVLNTEKKVHVKSEDHDVEMRDVEAPTTVDVERQVRIEKAREGTMHIEKGLRDVDVPPNVDTERQARSEKDSQARVDKAREERLRADKTREQRLREQKAREGKSREHEDQRRIPNEPRTASQAREDKPQEEPKQGRVLAEATLAEEARENKAREDKAREEENQRQAILEVRAAEKAREEKVQDNERQRQAVLKLRAEEEEREKTRREDAERRRRQLEEAAAFDARLKRLQEDDEQRRVLLQTRLAEEAQLQEARRRKEVEEQEKRRRLEEEEQKKRLDEELLAKRQADEKKKRESDEADKRRRAEEAIRAQKQEAERKAREEAERTVREEAERKAREEAERKAREEVERKAREEVERKAREEVERKAREEADRKAREEADRKAREEADRKAREEADRKAREEAERQAREASERKAAERKAHEEVERKARDEKARDEAARKAREEFEQKKREEVEKRRREVEESKRQEEERQRQVEERIKRQADERAAKEREREVAEEREARMRRELEERLELERIESLHLRKVQDAIGESRIHETALSRQEDRRRELVVGAEEEKRRVAAVFEAYLSKLPPLLRWFSRCDNPQRPEIAQKFSIMQGVRYDCICPGKTGTPEGRELWLLNSQVALVLGEHDLNLQCETRGWDRVVASDIAKSTIWRLEADRYALTASDLHEFGNEEPNYFKEPDADRMSSAAKEELRKMARELFMTTHLFFVKASDVMNAVPTYEHLKDVKLTMEYREIPEHDSQLNSWGKPLQKWKSDPDARRYMGFAPGNKYYIGGVLVSEELPGLSPVSKTPFPVKRVPRRGLQAVLPSDPAYAQLCREQGLGHLVGLESRVPNGVHLAQSPTNTRLPHLPNEPSLLPRSVMETTSIAVNGSGQQPISPASEAADTHPPPRSMVNGINGTTHVGSI